MTSRERTKEDLLKEIDSLQEELDKLRLIESIFRHTEKELRIKDKALASSLNPIVFADLEGNLTYANKAFLLVWGYFYDAEVLGRSIYSFWDEGTDVGRMLSQSGSWSGELNAKKKDGTVFYVQLFVSVIKDDEGHPVCLMGSFVDISERKETERKAVESKDFLNSLINAIPDPIFVKDEKHRWVMLNDEMCERLGYPREHLIGKSDHDIFPKDQADVFWEKDDQVFRDGGTLVNEEKITFSEGEIRTISTVKTLCVDDVTGEKFIIGTIRDVTERKTAELALQEQFHFLRQLLDSMPTPVFYKDTNCRYLDCNVAFETFMGMQRDQIIGKNVFDVVQHDLALRHDEMDKALLAGGGTQTYESLSLRADGSMRNVWYSKAAYTDTLGNIIGLVAIMLDMTDRKKAEEELRHSEEKFRHIAENTSDFIALTDFNGIFLYVSPSHRRLGYEPEELMGKHGLDLISEDDRQHLEELLAKYSNYAEGDMERLRTANVYEKLGFRFLDKKGKEHYVEATANFVKSLTGKGYNILMVSRDVTERRRAELELAKSYETTLDIIENAPFGIYLVNLKGDIDYVNPAMLAIAGDKYEEFTNMNVFRDLPGYEEIGLSEKIRSGLLGEYFEVKNVKYTSRYGSKTTVRNFTGIPMGDEADRKVLMIIEDITEIKRAEKELMDKSAIIDQANRQLERKVDELQEAMKHIKRLEGLVPICMSCKKMRVEGVDPKDSGAWVPLERYISEKTNASLTHGLCPECAKKMYGEAVKEKNGGKV